MQQAVFTAKQAASLAGMPYQTLNTWIKEGFFRPSVQEASGRGSARRFSYEDVMCLRVLNLLRQKGVAFELLSSIVRVFVERQFVAQEAALTVVQTDPVGALAGFRAAIQSSWLVVGDDGEARVLQSHELGRLWKGTDQVLLLVNLGRVVMALQSDIIAMWGEIKER